jgi:Flp pilus assembly protein TadG
MFAPRGQLKLLQRLAGDRSGSIILKFALAFPAIVTLSLGAIDLTAVHATKAKLQSLADAAALAGANELGLAVQDDVPVERARAWVSEQMNEWGSDAPDVTTDIKVVTLEDGVRAIRVNLAAHRDSFFANLLPPGGWHFRAQSTAATVGLTPLCVLAHGSFGKKAIDVEDDARINAPACMVHSNKEILVRGGRIAAAAVQAVDTASGNISPAPATGAAPIEDPFTKLPLVLSLCNRPAIERFDTGRHYIPAGTHCGGIVAEGTAELVLQPGDHWFSLGALVLKDDATLQGSDVVLIFDNTSQFQFKDRSLINLDGRKSGPFAGFVMAATRLNFGNFDISSDHVESLLGVLYVPEGRLRISGTSDVARESAWTVIVAKWLELNGSPSLYMNANYQGSTVPVPQGVGPRAGGSRLVE